MIHYHIQVWGVGAGNWRDHSKAQFSSFDEGWDVLSKLREFDKNSRYRVIGCDCIEGKEYD